MPATGLSDEHLALLRASAISDEIIDERGYFTADRKAELRDLGFADFQRSVPALVIPLWGAAGQFAGYQSRPDRPRQDAQGDIVKYETPAGASPALDVPARCRAELGDPDAPLWITEGARKVDAAATAGLCAVSLSGVDAWHCRLPANYGGASVVLPDFVRVPWEGREVVLAFDSDAMTKASVHGALERLSSHLTKQGAIVKFCYLPAPSWIDQREKTGLDDFFADGNDADALRALVEDKLRAAPKAPKAPPLPTAVLLEGVRKALSRFVRLPSEEALDALALWTLHTHALEGANVTAYLLVRSPTKQSGKTLLLEILEAVAREPVRAASITPAALFQAVEQWAPTLLIDEVDAIFHGRASERTEELRGVLNAGNRRGASVIRGTQGGTPQRFSIFCPKALAGISNGRLPDTVLDRAIVIEMDRLGPGELDSVSRFRPTSPGTAAACQRLRDALADWALVHEDGLRDFRADPIRELSHRLDEAWEPLRAIASLAGGDWPERARKAAIALAGAVDERDGQDRSIVLLSALREMFGDDVRALSTEAIVERLNRDDALPFGDMRNGQGINARGIAQLLRAYKMGDGAPIRPKVVRIGPATPRGFHRDQFSDAWSRYLPAQHAQHPQHASPDGKGDVAPVADVAQQRGPDAGHVADWQANGHDAETIEDLERELWRLTR